MIQKINRITEKYYELIDDLLKISQGSTSNGITVKLEDQAFEQLIEFWKKNNIKSEIKKLTGLKTSQQA